MNLKKLTTLQKVLLGIAAAGMVVVIYDQFGGPASAEAHVETAPVATAIAVAPAADAAPATPTSPAKTSSLGARLRSNPVDASSPLNDPFARTIPAASASPSASTSDGAFAGKYRMTGAMTSGNSRAAIINGVLVKCGQSIDGYRLLEVTPTSATFESRRGERVILNMRSETPDSSPAVRRRG